MAINIKWTGIEQYKYGLTARWYVSAYYGNDIDVDGVGYYNPATNPTGHGGPTRPFAGLTKLIQDAQILSNAVVVFDSGAYTTSLTSASKSIIAVGDGTVVFSDMRWFTNDRGFFIFNIIAVDSSVFIVKDSKVFYGIAYTQNYALTTCERNMVVRSNMGFYSASTPKLNNNIFIDCTGYVYFPNRAVGNFIKSTINNSLSLRFISQDSQTIIDYNILIGSYATQIQFNGKTSNVSKEDIAVSGIYMIKSYSEVDLFGNPSRSGATVPQLQTLFNNYFSPVYLDTWQDLDLSLKPTASNLIKFGGLNGTYIGALPVGHYFSAETLWNTYKDAINTSNIDYDMLSKGLVISAGQEFGTFRSTRISLGAPYILEPINFFANLVYNADGTPRQGVSNQRIDTTPDDLPDNTKNQRVVYDFKLQYSETVGGVLTPFLNFELNKTPEVDNSGRSNLDEAFVALERQKIKVADFIIELTLRRIIID